MFQVVSWRFIKNGTSKWSTSMTKELFFLYNHIVFRVVKHSLCEKVWAKLWPLSKNTKQDVGITLDSVKVVCLCEKGRSEAISSYNDYTYSSGWGLLETPDLMNMPYSVELKICFIITESALLASARYYLGRYSQAAAAIAATTPRLPSQINKIVKRLTLNNEKWLGPEKIL